MTDSNIRTACSGASQHSITVPLLPAASSVRVHVRVHVRPGWQPQQLHDLVRLGCVRLQQRGCEVHPQLLQARQVTQRARLSSVIAGLSSLHNHHAQDTHSMDTHSMRRAHTL